MPRGGLFETLHVDTSNARLLVINNVGSSKRVDGGQLPGVLGFLNEPACACFGRFDTQSDVLT